MEKRVRLSKATKYVWIRALFVWFILIAYFTIRWIGAKRLNELLWVGFLWLTLTVAFEFLFGRFVMGLAWEQILAGYNVAAGGLMPLGLLVLLFSPIIATKLRTRRK